jgi:hypothetical protein
LNHKDSQIIDEKFIEKYEKLIEIHQS